MRTGVTVCSRTPSGLRAARIFLTGILRQPGSQTLQTLRIIFRVLGINRPVEFVAEEWNQLPQRADVAELIGFADFVAHESEEILTGLTEFTGFSGGDEIVKRGNWEGGKLFMRGPRKAQVFRPVLNDHGQSYRSQFFHEGWDIGRGSKNYIGESSATRAVPFGSASAS